MTIADRILRELQASGSLDDDDLAARLDVRRQQVNQRCRLLAAQSLITRARGRSGKIVNIAGTAPPPDPLPTPTLDLDEPWYWEGSVQAAVRKHLLAEGWTILSESDTATQQRGIDLLAKRGGVHLAVEVKGYPKTTYQRGPKQGQPKPTSPTLQAQHWFSDALLSVFRLRTKHPDYELAAAFPDYPRYRSLLKDTGWAFGKLGLTVFLVSEGGGVEAYPLTSDASRDDWGRVRGGR